MRKGKGASGIASSQHSHHGKARKKGGKAKIGNLFEKIMKENFLNLVKEIDMQIQEAQSPKQDGCKEAAPSKTHRN